jgi:hypothetical protein
VSNRSVVDECDCCGLEVETEKTDVDHCHRCGVIRGRVCRFCNRRRLRASEIDWEMKFRSHGVALNVRMAAYLDKTHWPEELSCLRAQMSGTDYKAWVAIGRPWDWWNTVSYQVGAC